MVTSDTRVKIDATALKNAIRMYRSEYQAQARADLFTSGQTRGVLKATSDILRIIESLESTERVRAAKERLEHEAREHAQALLDDQKKQRKKRRKKKHKGAKHE